MLTWLLVSILAYLFFGLAALGDKLVLAGTAQRAPRPKSYTFYVGVFSLFVLLFIPFTKFGFPTATEAIWIALDAIVHVFGLYTMYVAVEKFDVSKVVATIGATQPIFIFILTLLFFGPQITPATEIVAFVLLFAGSVIISVEKNLVVTGNYIKITLLSSVMFSLDYIFSKFVFLNQPFLQGIIWIRICVFLFALLFILQKSSREEIFAKQVVSNKKTQKFFLFAQTCGGVANFLQSFAIALAPVAFLAIVNSLRGIQYVFLFIITLFFSYFFPKILKEEVSKTIIFQKIISIILIASGLAILVVY